MQHIIGQTNLLAHINNYTLQTLPKTLMLIGPDGCGKHLISKYIADKFKLDFIEVNENITADELGSFNYKTIDTLYLINLNKFTEKQQNQFLKFIEEPTKTVYIVLIANSELGIINTVLNRCTKLHFDNYTKEDLITINNSVLTNPIVYDIFKTPGKLINLTDSTFNNIFTLASTLVHKINQATYANTLTITTKMNYKDLYDKIDFNLFLDVVEYVAFIDFKNTKNLQSMQIFKITNKFKQYINNGNFLKETLMLNYLTTLWEATH